MEHQPLRGRGLGIALVGAAAVLWSTAAVFVRMLPLDIWTVVAWRSFFAALSLFVIIVAWNGRRWLEVVIAMGRPGLAAVPVSAVSMFSYVAALKLTTVANVMIIYATLPFIAAAIAFVWVGERLKPRVLWASAISLCGILVVAGGATRPQDIAGSAFALVMTGTFAVVLVMARRYPSLDMAPSNALAALVCGAICWSVADGATPPASELAILALFGFATTGLAYLLFLIGGRYIPSSEAGLIGLLDVVLGPFWVWLAFGEQPGLAAMAGGALVLAGVWVYLRGEQREARLAAAGQETAS